MKYNIFLILLIFGNVLIAQTGINTTTPVSSAELDIYSTSKGVLLPVLTDAEMTSIGTPATGLIVYNSTYSSYYYYDGSKWTGIGTKGLSLQDTDNDTKIQVEESSDDDIVRMDIGTPPTGDFVTVNTSGVTSNDNYTLPAGKTLKIGVTPLIMPATRGANGTVLSTDGAGNWNWTDANGGLGIASGIQTMNFVEARVNTALGNNTYFTPVIPFSSITVDTMEVYVEALGTGRPELRCAILNSSGDTLATSDICQPTATGLFTMPIKGANYGTAGNTGPLLEAANLYYFAVTCINQSNVQLRSSGSSQNPFTKRSTSATAPLTWDFATTIEGWNSPNNITTAVAASICTMTATGCDPYITSPAISIAAANYKYVLYKFQNKTTSNSGEFYWNNGSSYFRSTSHTASDTKQRIYINSLYDQANWTGTVTSVRFDPGGCELGDYDVDYIKLIPEYNIFKVLYPSATTTSVSIWMVAF